MDAGCSGCGSSELPGYERFVVARLCPGEAKTKQEQGRDTEEHPCGVCCPRVSPSGSLGDLGWKGAPERLIWSCCSS